MYFPYLVDTPDFPYLVDVLGIVEMYVWNPNKDMLKFPQVIGSKNHITLNHGIESVSEIQWKI